MIDWIESFANFLMTYGAWGFCALLIVAVVILYRKVGVVTNKYEILLINVMKEGTACIESNINAFRQIESRLSDNEEHLQSMKEYLVNFKAFLGNVEKLVEKSDLQADEIRRQIEASKVLIEHVNAQSNRRRNG